MINGQNDLFLISLIKQGDKRALDSLFKKYYNSLCRFASYLTSRNDLAEEIVADVFFRIWDKRENLTVEKKLALLSFYCYPPHSYQLYEAGETGHGRAQRRYHRRYTRPGRYFSVSRAGIPDHQSYQLSPSKKKSNFSVKPF